MKYMKDADMLVLARQVSRTIAEAVNAESIRLGTTGGVDPEFVEIALTIATRRIARAFYTETVNTLPAEMFERVMRLTDLETIQVGHRDAPPEAQA